MNAQQLKYSILQEAIMGKLVPQDPNDEPASVLLDKIREEKKQLVKEGKLKKKDLEEIPISEDERPFEIPESWVWCRLNDICIFLSRGKSPSYSDIPNEYPVFAQKCNLKDGGVSLEQARFLNPETVSKWQEEYHLRTDDVLVNSTGTGTVCRTRLFHERYLGNYPFTVPDSHVSVVRTSESISSAFIFHLFNSKIFQDYWEDRLAGSTNQKELYIGVLQNTTIPLPPLAEQKRIVAKIEELLPKIDEYGKAQEALDKLNEELPEKLKKSILQEAIMGKLVPQDPNDEPASVLLDKIREEKKQLVKEGKLKKKDLVETPINEDEIPFEIPESWEWCKLIDICTFLSRGKSPTYSDVPNNYPVFAQKCNLKEGGISLNQARFLKPETISKWQDEYHLRTDDVLVNSTGTGTVCRTRLFNDSYLGNYPFTVPDSHVSVVRTSDNICSTYICYLFNSKVYQDYWEDRLAGSTNQKELYIGVLQNTIIPLPPLSEQKRIVAKIEELMHEIDKLKV